MISRINQILFRRKTAAEKARIIGHDDIAALLDYVNNSTTSMGTGFFGVTSCKNQTRRAGNALADHGLQRFLNPFIEKILESNSRDSHDSSLIEYCVNGHWQSLNILVFKQ